MEDQLQDELLQDKYERLQDENKRLREQLREQLQEQSLVIYKAKQYSGISYCHLPPVCV